MSILLSSLQSLKDNQRLCEVISEAPDDLFFCQIVDFNEELTLVRRILSDNGEIDGYSLIFTANIKSLAWEGELLEQVEILLKDTLSKENNTRFDKISNININNHFFEIIKRINSLFGHISIYEIFDAGDFYFGQIKDIDEYFMLIHLLGDKSSMDDKNLVLRLEDVGRIDFGGIYDESMLKLHQIKKKIIRKS